MPSRPRLSRLGALSATLLALAVSCSGSSELVSEGSNTNWLLECVEEAECGASTACTCGVCSKRCERDVDCAPLAGARCVAVADAAWMSLCTADPDNASGVCLPGCEPGSCDPGQACVSGACVFVTPPNTPLCAGVSAPDADSRRRADELLAAFQAVRVAGGVVCGGGAPSQPGPPLRVDARSTCAAVVHALDMNATRMRGLIDSEGRDTAARLEGAGYSPSFWAEAFALSGQSAEAALDIMLSDEDACRGLTSADARDIGVASAGDAWVIVLGAE